MAADTPFPRFTSQTIEEHFPGAYAISAATRQALHSVPGIIDVQEI